MKVQSRVQGDATVIAVTGEFVGELVPKFQQAVSEGQNAGRRDVLVDLSGTKLLDSSALEALTALQRQVEEQLGMLRICVTDATLRKVFEVTRLDQPLSIDASLNEALAALSGGFTLAGSDRTGDSR
jgi:anti-anti-sigma factor